MPSRNHQQPPPPVFLSDPEKVAKLSAMLVATTDAAANHAEAIFELLGGDERTHEAAVMAACTLQLREVRAEFEVIAAELAARTPDGADDERR